MSDFLFKSTESQIQILYNRLKLSTSRIINLVDYELDFKGVFNTEKHSILDNSDYDEFIKFQSLLKNLNNIIYFNSLILISFSTFEFAFKIICKNVQDYICQLNEFKDPKSDVLNQCKTYLSKTTNLVDFTKDDLENIYLRIKNVNKLRNLITHHNGNLIRGNIKIAKEHKDYNLYSSDHRLMILGSGQVFIDDKEYIITFQRDTEFFLQIILSQINNRITI